MRVWSSRSKTDQKGWEFKAWSTKPSQNTHASPVMIVLCGVAVAYAVLWAVCWIWVTSTEPNSTEHTFNVERDGRKVTDKCYKQ